jgi:L-fuculose-phosphate aldolase
MSEILKELVEVARELVAQGLVTGAGGNVSARDGDGMWISPSGYSLGEARALDYARVSLASGELERGERRPSSEVLMHLAILRARPEVDVVLHAHPRFVNALATAGHELRATYPDFHVYLGGHVPHLEYLTVTTAELAERVGALFAAPDCHGLVHANHGTITVGASAKEALFRTLAMEEQAEILWRALAVGEPRYLSDEEKAALDRLGSEEYRRELLARMGGGA